MILISDFGVRPWLTTTAITSWGRTRGAIANNRLVHLTFKANLLAIPKSFHLKQSMTKIKILSSLELGTFPWLKYGSRMFYSHNCDFKGPLINEVQPVVANQCAVLCEQHTVCTHYTWSPPLGGTCAMKTGGAGFNQDNPIPSANLRCGYKHQWKVPKIWFWFDPWFVNKADEPSLCTI